MTRLLYVGATRARDYLVLALRRTKDATAWLDALVDHEGRPVLSLPSETGEQAVLLGGRYHDIVVRDLDAPGEDAQEPAAEPVYGPPPAAAAPSLPPYRLRPSEAMTPTAIRVAEEIALGPRLPLIGAPDMARLGEALHRFLAADRPHAPGERHLELARRLLASWQVSALSPESCVEAANRLRGFLEERHPGAVWHREWPVAGRLGQQRARGRIDLVIELDEGLVLVDHKTFPGRPDLWPERATEAGAQLLAYATLAEAATGRPSELWVHMPVVGRLMRLESV